MTTTSTCIAPAPETATLCGAPAPETRIVDGLVMAMCSAHAAELDAERKEAITIKPVDAPLYLQYPGQTSPQRVHVLLDCRDGELWADSDGETGGGMPMAVYHNLISRWTIPCLKEHAANALLEEIAPIAARVIEGFEVEWNGHNNVGRYSEASVAACEEIAALCENAGADADDLYQVHDASDFFGALGSAQAQARELGITATTTDEELAAIGAREITKYPEVDRIEGMDSHLDHLRAQMREALAPWREVQIWSGDASWSGPVSWESPSRDGRTGDREDVLRMLREYRDTEALHGAFLVDPDDYDAEDAASMDALCDAGPKVAEIDWTGLDTAEAA